MNRSRCCLGRLGLWAEINHVLRGAGSPDRFTEHVKWHFGGWARGLYTPRTLFAGRAAMRPLTTVNVQTDCTKYLQTGRNENHAPVRRLGECVPSRRRCARRRCSQCRDRAPCHATAARRHLAAAAVASSTRQAARERHVHTHTRI